MINLSYKVKTFTNVYESSRLAETIWNRVFFTFHIGSTFHNGSTFHTGSTSGNGYEIIILEPQWYTYHSIPNSTLNKNMCLFCSYWNVLQEHCIFSRGGCMSYHSPCIIHLVWSLSISEKRTVRKRATTNWPGVLTQCPRVNCLGE